MIRLQYQIVDTVDACLEKLGSGDVYPSRRAIFQESKKISTTLSQSRDASKTSSIDAEMFVAALEDLREEGENISW
jgi:hypothetical protein